VLQLPCHDISAADIGIQRLLAEHHVETPVPVRQHALPVQPRGCPLFGIVRHAHELGEDRQDGHGIPAGLQQARDDRRLVDPEQPGAVIHRRRCLLPAPGASPA